MIGVAGLALITILGPGVADSLNCDSCKNLILTSTSGFEDEWPIFTNEPWTIENEWDGLPQYRCDGCFGSRKKIIWMENRWSIVDCLPDEPTACAGVHEILRSPSVNKGVCLWDTMGTWEYCTGTIAPTGCTEYSQDTTITFTCVDQ